MVVKSASVSCETVMNAYPQLFTECLGDKSTTFSRVSSPEAATENCMAFLNNPQALREGLSSSARICVVPKKLKAEAEAARGTKTILVSPNVELAMSKVLNQFFLKTPYRDEATNGRHATAVVDSSAEIASDVCIGAHAVIGPRVKIGSGSFIGANTVVEADVQIGENTTLHPLVYVGHSCLIGNNCEIYPHAVIGKEGYGYAHDEKGNHYKIPHQGRVVLEDDVHVGSGCTFDRGTFLETRIGQGTKFDNQCHIAHNCKIGRNGLLTAHFVMAGSSSIGNNFVAGGKSVVTGHIQVGDNIQIAALSGIAKDLNEPGQYGGVPLMPLQAFIKMKAALVQLPEMRKQLMRLTKKVFPDENI